MPLPTYQAPPPTENQISVFYRGAGGSWLPVAVKVAGIAVPKAKSPKIESEMNYGEVISAHVTEYPLPTGKMTAYNITPRAGAFQLRDAVLGINGGEAITPTNDTISRPVDSNLRLVDLKFETDQGATRGGLLVEVMTGVHCDFSSDLSTSPTVSTYDVTLTVYGTITVTLPS